MKRMAKAVFTLSAFTLFERILGFIFKIFLSRKLGAEAMGVYQVSFSVFILLLTLTTSGLPLIVSKLTAKYRAKNSLTEEGAVSSASLIISTVFSLSVCVIVLAFNRLIGRLFADDGSRTLLLLMLPALFFSGIYASLRGNLWGRQRYATVSLLELSEQVARIGACVILLAIFDGSLNMVGVSLSIGCFVAAAICAICFFASGAKLKNPRGKILPLLKTSLPVTASRASTSLTGTLTAIVAPFLLTLSGTNNAMYEYGYSMGMALPLLYVPLTVVGSLAFAMIPSLSEATACGNQTLVKRQIDKAISMSLILGVLFFPVFFILGEPIGVFVYGSRDAGRFMSYAAWLLIPLSLESITSSLMNSLDMELRGLIHYLLCAAVMFAAFFILGQRFSVQLMSVCMGLSWTFAAILNVYALKKKAGISLKFVLIFVVCSALCVPTCLLISWLYNILKFMPDIFRIGLSGGIGFVFICALCVLLRVLKFDFIFKERSKECKTVA